MIATPDVCSTAFLIGVGSASLLFVSPAIHLFI